MFNSWRNCLSVLRLFVLSLVDFLSKQQAFVGWFLGGCCTVSIFLSSDRLVKVALLWLKENNCYFNESSFLIEFSMPPNFNSFPYFMQAPPFWHQDVFLYERKLDRLVKVALLWLKQNNCHSNESSFFIEFSMPPNFNSFPYFMQTPLFWHQDVFLYERKLVSCAAVPCRAAFFVTLG